MEISVSSLACPPLEEFQIGVNASNFVQTKRIGGNLLSQCPAYHATDGSSEHSPNTTLGVSQRDQSGGQPSHSSSCDRNLGTLPHQLQLRAVYWVRSDELLNILLGPARKRLVPALGDAGYVIHDLEALPPRLLVHRPPRREPSSLLPFRHSPIFTTAPDRTLCTPHQLKDPRPGLRVARRSREKAPNGHQNKQVEPPESMTLVLTAFPVCLIRPPPAACQPSQPPGSTCSAKNFELPFMATATTAFLPHALVLPGRSRWPRCLPAQASCSKRIAVVRAQAEPDAGADSESDDEFEARLSKLQRKVTSGSGKKAEVRKAKKEGAPAPASAASAAQKDAVFLPPVPLRDPVSSGLPVQLGFNSYTERLNGRFAAIGLASVLLVELATGSSFIKFHDSSVIGLQVYTVLSAAALFIKFEKESVSVWPKA